MLGSRKFEEKYMKKNREKNERIKETKIKVKSKILLLLATSNSF